MADNGPNKNPPPAAEKSADVTTQDLVAFFDRAKVGTKCPICPSEQWLLLPRDGGGVLELPNPVTDGGMKAVAAYIAVCKNCGFIRHHSKIILDRKITEVKAGDIPDGQ